MILKVGTEGEWAYHGELKSVKPVEVFYKMILNEEACDPPRKEEDFHPEFYDWRKRKIKSPEIIYLEDIIEIAPADIPVGEEEAHEFILAKIVRCVSIKGEKTSIGFNGVAYLLNDEGKTVEKFRN